MRLAGSLASFLLYSNIFIAFCATALVAQVSILTGNELPLSVYLFTFFATLVEYNIQRFIVLAQRSEVPPEPRYHWLFAHRKFFYVMFGCSAAALLVLLLMMPSSTYIWIALSVLLTLLYSFPIIPLNSGWKRLRAVPHMKIVTIALVWTISTMFIPYAVSGARWSDIIIPAVIRFLFVVAITIPFDIRDIAADTRRGLKTIPIVFGPSNAYRIALVILSVICLISWFSHIKGDNYYGISMIVTSLITIVFIVKEGWRDHPYYYYGLLDGTMLLAPLINYLLFEYLVK